MESFKDTEHAKTPSGPGESTLRDDADGPLPEAGALEGGKALGRYVVLRELGAGSMGTVYLGYDPELDRRVALKMLKGSNQTAKNRTSLLREAQAMAKLRHPSVVTVHDVGEHDGRVYIAMEFIQGITLGAWGRAVDRGWRDVLDMYRDAGEGLVAAHGQGLIHRDFKPENVMVDDVGRVRVMDFGLARESSAEPVSSAPPTEVSSGKLLTAATLGHVAGSPAYMAPEQFRGEELTAATDQYAFCVSLWEAICGERPFAEDTFASIYMGKMGGRIRSVPKGVALPRWLEMTLRRGLEPDVSDRWPSMAALLTALERGRGRWRWQAAVVGLAGCAVLAAGVVMDERKARKEHAAKLDVCTTQGAAIGEIWNGKARAQLEAGLLDTELAFAPRSVQTLVPWFDEYAKTWSAAREEVCVHETIDVDWEPELVDSAKWCLEDRRLQLEATVAQIAGLDRVGARRAVRLGSYLDRAETCLDRDALSELPVPPSELRDGIRTVRSRLNDSDTLRYQGKYLEALEVATEARQEAEELGWTPLTANARFIEGRTQITAGEFESGTTSLTTAYFEGLSTGSTEVAFRAARSLVLGLSAEGRFREAGVWARHADVLGRHLHDLGGLDEAEGHYLMISVHSGLGDHEAAIEAGETASEMRAAVLGPDHPVTAAAYRELGLAYIRAGRPRPAVDHIERAAKIWAEVSTEHPYTSRMAGFLGDALLELGRLDEALVQLELCVDIGERVYADDRHPKLLVCLLPLGALHTEMGRLEEAQVVYERSLQIVQERIGFQAPALASILLGLASLDIEEGRHELALERCNEALKIFSRSPDAGDADVADARRRRAEVLFAMGQPNEGREELESVVASLEQADGPDAEELAAPLLDLARLQLELGELDAAREAYVRVRGLGNRRDELRATVGLSQLALSRGEAADAKALAAEALEQAEKEELGDRLLAPARWAMARAELAAGGELDDARKRAEQALEGFRALHDHEASKEVEDWLDAL